MLKLVAFTVLLCASFMLSGYEGSVTLPVDKIGPDDEFEPMSGPVAGIEPDIGPIVELNRHVKDLLARAKRPGYSYKDVCELVQKFSALGKKLSISAKELVRRISELPSPNRPRELCVQKSLQDLVALIDDLSDLRVSMSTEELEQDALWLYVRNYVREAQSLCLVPDGMHMLAKFNFDQYKLLIKLDAICAPEYQAKASHIKGGIALLDCASNLFGGDTFESKLQVVLKDMYETRNSDKEKKAEIDETLFDPKTSRVSAAPKQASSKPESITSYLKEELFGKCKKLVDNLETLDMLEKATEIGMAVLKTQERPAAKFNFMYEYAFRAALCGLFIEQGVNYLPNLIDIM